MEWLHGWRTLIYLCQIILDCVREWCWNGWMLYWGCTWNMAQTGRRSARCLVAVHRRSKTDIDWWKTLATLVRAHTDNSQCNLVVLIVCIVLIQLGEGSNPAGKHPDVLWQWTTRFVCSADANSTSTSDSVDSLSR